MTDHYFVTGATGAVGSALIPLLLKKPETHIWALMRADSKAHLQQRLDELIAFWELDVNQAQKARRRITPLQGDTDQPHFALADEVYTEISQHCTHIIHCAGVVRMNLALEIAQTHAVGATKNIVELALTCRTGGKLQKIEFVSTVGVGGRLPGILPETWITQPRTFHNTYEQAKAEAEDYLREQIELHHLPVTVHRPSMVVGNSQTGKIIHYQIFYHICEFLSGRRTFGLLPKLGDAQLDTVPVDYVASIIYWSSSQTDLNGKILHICSGPEHSIKLVELQRLTRRCFSEQGKCLPLLISLPIGMFNGVLKILTPIFNEKVRRTIKTFPFFLDYLADRQTFGISQTQILLTEKYAAFRMPVYQNYLENVLLRYLNNK